MIKPQQHVTGQQEPREVGGVQNKEVFMESLSAGPSQPSRWLDPWCQSLSGWLEL